MEKKPLSIPESVFVTEAALKQQQNLSSEENANRAMQITRWHLKLLGIWPLPPNPSCFDMISKHFIVLLCVFLLLFIFVPGILYIYVEVDDSHLAVKVSGALSFCAMAFVEYCSLLSRRGDIAKCKEHLINDWKRITSADDRMIMMTYAQYGRWGSMICAVFMYSGGIFYAGILPCVAPSVIDENNVTIKHIAYPSYYGLFDPQGKFVHPIIFLTQCCCALVMHSIASGSCNVAVVFAVHACGQLKILSRPLEYFVNNISSCEKPDDILANIIQHHIRTLKFISILEKILNKICLVEIVGRAFSICHLEYYFLLEWQDSDAIGLTTYTILLISESFNIFLYCYIGDLLAEECRKVGEVTYMLNWYKLSAKNSRQITLILLTAQNPVTITAGRIIDLSLDTFVTVLRTSFVYFNLLRQVTE